jgi:hypothetical protein
VSEVVEHFAKQQKETKPLANEEDIKSNAEIMEDKNEIFLQTLRHYRGWA